MSPSIRTTLAAVALLLAAASAQSQTSYTYSAAGDEVTDSKTGLIWRRCSEGQTWSGSTCTGTAAIYTHEQALAQAQSQAGTAGWRLPNVKELFSIVNKAFMYPAIDSTAFPGTQSSWYWSSTPYARSSSSAWSVNFYNGFYSNESRDSDYRVRLVR
jgi:hypothetical protein